MRGTLKRYLEGPGFYRFVQAMLAPAAATGMRRVLSALPLERGSVRRSLDVGCGPDSCLFGLGLDPIGIDLSISRVRALCRPKGRRGCCAASGDLPFRSGSFDLVCSFGLLHHLSDAEARRTVGEMIRVCSRRGAVIVFDAVPPASFRDRPLAWLIRKADRGEHIRTEGESRDLLPPRTPWRVSRYAYTLTGLEAVVMFHRKA